MATERLPMRNIREILRLKWTLKRSHCETARSLGISRGAVALEPLNGKCERPMIIPMTTTPVRSGAMTTGC